MVLFAFVLARRIVSVRRKLINMNDMAKSRSSIGFRVCVLVGECCLLVSLAACGGSGSSSSNGSGNSGGGSGAGGSGSGGGQVTVPATPMGLAASAGNQQVGLAWSASTGAASYNVKRGTASGGPYTQAANPTGTSYTDSGLTNGTTYYYVVSAVNTAGESANSSQASATPASPTANVTITVNSSQTKSISPYIYGLNFYSGVTGAPPQLTFDRAGGNRWTAYNWESNASNAGSDYLYENDDYLSSSTVPAEAVRSF